MTFLTFTTFCGSMKCVNAIGMKIHGKVTV